MEPAFRDVHIPTYHRVAVRPQPPGKFTAWATSVPEIRAVAATEDEAIGQVKQLLTEWFATTRLVEVKVPTLRGVNPVLEFAGHAKDDPDFELYLEEIRRFRQEEDDRYRQEEDKRECSNSSSTPTT